jgi:hypothetical protein
MSSSILEYKAIEVCGMANSNPKEGMSVELRIADINLSV